MKKYNNRSIRDTIDMAVVITTYDDITFMRRGVRKQFYYESGINPLFYGLIPEETSKWLPLLNSLDDIKYSNITD